MVPSIYKHLMPIIEIKLQLLSPSPLPAKGISFPGETEDEFPRRSKRARG